MKTPSPPPAPDPVATSQAQSAANKETAIAQSRLNMVDQEGPYGSLRYEEIGTSPDGVPRFRATTSLSPTQRRLMEQQDALGIRMNDIAGGQMERINSVLSSPVSLDNAAVEGRLFELGRKRLDPMFGEQEEALRTRLANQGINAGTAAYDTEMRRFSEGRNDAYNNLALSGRQQAIAEILAGRNQPINEITALMSGGQVTMPGFQPTPQTGIANTDVMGAHQMAYQGALNNYNQQMGARNAMIGAVAGVAGSALGGWMGKPSDLRVKTDIRRVGTLDNGLGVYAYRYAWGGPEEIGVLAQEVERRNPAAVREIGGVKHVDYSEAVR